MPSIRGISTSRVMTSGTSSAMRRAATKGSEATPMTSMPGSADSTSTRVWRTLAESSITRTRTFGMTSGLPENGVGDGDQRQIDARDAFGMADEQIAAGPQTSA